MSAKFGVDFMQIKITEKEFVNLLGRDDANTIATYIHLGRWVHCSKRTMNIIMKDGPDQLRKLFIISWYNRKKSVSGEDMEHWLSHGSGSDVKMELLKNWAHTLPADKILDIAVANRNLHRVTLGIIANKNLKIREDLALHILNLRSGHSSDERADDSLKEALLSSDRFRPTQKILKTCEESDSRAVKRVYEDRQQEWNNMVLREMSGLNKSMKKSAGVAL